MKNARKFLLTILGLALAMQMTFVNQSYAQNKAQNATAESQRLKRVMDPNADVEEFRQELTNYFTEMEDTMRLFSQITVVREKLDKNGLNPLATIAQAKLSIAYATPEDLRLMRYAYAKLPGWRGMPQSIDGLIKPELRQQLKTRFESKQNGGNIQMDAATTDNCQDAIDADITNTDISIAQGFSLAAHAAADIVPPVLNIPAVVAYVVTDTTVITLETLKAIKDDCTQLDISSVQTIIDSAKTDIINNDNYNKSDIINNDNSNKSDIINNVNGNTTTVTTAITAAQTSINNTSSSNTSTITTAITNAKTDIVNNDNSNKTMIVNNDNLNAATLNTNLTTAKNMIVANDNTNTANIITNANTNTANIITNANNNTAFLDGQITAAKNELRDLILRTQIEADLAENDNASYVALYVTPTAQGGYLDFVQFIVTDTLAKMQASGINTKNAQSFLNKANADKASGDYKSAYANYRKAYKAAVN